MMSAEATIDVVLNGEPRTVAAGLTLLALLEELGREPRAVAVEHNGTIVPRQAFGETALGPGDRLEVVHFVQGGAPELQRA